MDEEPKCWDCNDTGRRLYHSPTPEDYDNFIEISCECTQNINKEKPDEKL